MIKKEQQNEAKIIGAKIKQLRLKMGLTQEELSEKIDIDNKRLSRIETGRSFPTLKIAGELKKIFNYDFFNLIENKKLTEIEIPDSLYVQALNILNSARTKEERALYLEALKHTQKCFNLPR